MTPRTATQSSRRSEAGVPELTRAAVIERALQLADAESLAAVSIRRLASDFHVTPMALYWHVKNKDELLAAMGDDFYASIQIDDIASQPWFDGLTLVMTRLVDSLRRHPASAGLAMTRILQCERGQLLTEITLQLLSDAGFSASQSADIARTALQTAVTMVAGLPGAEFGVPADAREAALDHKRTLIAALPADKFPCLRVSVDWLTDCEDTEAYFTSGTEFFLAGVEAMHRRLTS